MYLCSKFYEYEAIFESFGVSLCLFEPFGGSICKAEKVIKKREEIDFSFISEELSIII